MTPTLHLILVAKIVQPVYNVTYTVKIVESYTPVSALDELKLTGFKMALCLGA